MGSRRATSARIGLGPTDQSLVLVILARVPGHPAYLRKNLE